MLYMHFLLLIIVNNHKKLIIDLLNKFITILRISTELLDIDIDKYYNGHCYYASD